MVRNIHWQGAASVLAAVAVASLCVAAVLTSQAQNRKVSLGQNEVLKESM
jgi:hypothetical protein